MARKARKNAGLIGLGIIGSRVAAALRAGGFHVYVWNRTPRAEPNFLSSPSEVVEVCDVVQIFVSDAHALFEVIDAFADKLTPSHTIVCNSTVGPEAAIEAAHLVQERGARFLDAPFTGSKGAAEKRELVYYIGGDDETFRAAEPVLKASSKYIVRVGEIGQAATIKVATNMITAVTVQTMAEALAIVEHSGIAPSVLIEALEQNASRSSLTDMKLPKMVHGEFEPHFALKHMFKDVQLAIHIANSLAIDVPATTATAGVMYGGLSRGWADLDFSVLARIYREENDGLNEPLALEHHAAFQAAESGEPSPKEPDHNGTPPKETLSHMAAPPRPDEKLSKTSPEQKPAAPVKETLASITEIQPHASEKVTSKPSEPPPPREVLTADAKPQQTHPFNRIRRWFGTGNAG